MNRPSPRHGYRWEYHEGCDCASCPWKGACLGEDHEHWRQVSVSQSSVDRLAKSDETARFP